MISIKLTLLNLNNIKELRRENIYFLKTFSKRGSPPPSAKKEKGKRKKSQNDYKKPQKQLLVLKSREGVGGLDLGASSLLVFLYAFDYSIPAVKLILFYRSFHKKIATQRRIIQTLPINLNIEIFQQKYYEKKSTIPLNH